MSKRTVQWKENRVLSVETRKGLHVLAQMLKNPYLRFYNAFKTGEEEWESMQCSELDILFTKAVITKSFLKHSNARLLKNVLPDTEKKDSVFWIKTHSGFRQVTVWPDTENETLATVAGSSPGGMLVEMDLYKGGIYDHPSGIFDRIIDESIPLDSDEVINNSELMGLGTFPILNERLYLCHKFQTNVDPYKCLIFDQPPPSEYKLAIEIISGAGTKERREQIIEEYFNCV